ncbi:hypothetical protein DW056_07495 [Parabacteroides distasonis]|nr:hypothetical protein DW056_07495 [Parabacteroides distasonis]
MEDLWPDFEFESSMTPKEILLTQADFLSKKTSGVLIGEVHTCEPNDYLLYHALKCPSVSNPDLNKPIGHVLYIRAPFFNDYRFEILSITHYLLNMYPLQLNNVLNNCYYTIDSEEYLMKKLSEIFARRIFDEKAK